MLVTQFVEQLFCLLAWALLVIAAEGDPEYKSVPLRTHSLEAPYLDSDMQSRWFDFGGDTIIRADQYIRLTSDRPSQQGWLFSRVPITASNWEIEFEFKIHGAGNLHGDGFAMWLTKQRAVQGPVFGSVDKFEGLGIFFDTYKNNRPGTVFPYVMAMLGDGQTAYDQAHDGKANELAGCSARGLRTASIPTRARLTYYQDKSLTLSLQYKKPDEWIECFSLGPVAIPSVSYLGFSAETGELSDSHDIVSIQARNLYQTGERTRRRKDDKDKGFARKYDDVRKKGGRKSKGGWGWFFLKGILGMAVLGGGYVGWTTYRANKRHSRWD